MFCVWAGHSETPWLSHLSYKKAVRETEIWFLSPSPPLPSCTLSVLPATSPITLMQFKTRNNEVCDLSLMCSVLILQVCERTGLVRSWEERYSSFFLCWLHQIELSFSCACLLPFYGLPLSWERGNRWQHVHTTQMYNTMPEPRSHLSTAEKQGPWVINQFLICNSNLHRQE